MRERLNRESNLLNTVSRKSKNQDTEAKINPEIEKLLSECATLKPSPKPSFSSKCTEDSNLDSHREEGRVERSKQESDNSNKQIKRYDKYSDPRIDSTIFVGNISLHISEKELLKRLELKSSDIVSIRFRSLPIHPKFASNKKVGAALECFSGNSGTKNAYVILRDKNMMKSIIDKYSGVLLSGNYLRITPASKGNQFSTFDRKRTVFIGGLPRLCTEDELRKFVTISLNEDCVNSVRIIKSSTTGKPKGFGFVLFNDRKYVMLSIRALNGKMFRESTITVTKALSEEDVRKNREKIELEPRKNKKYKFKSKSNKIPIKKKLIKKTKNKNNRKKTDKISTKNN
ncbi:hypothetical protein FG386_003278 [Cryptosporidium ryanae]|uniref:uncharacterized protein n=1 Tax=Cryptosporidium ryanae TaxID=515981 RepID=UPI00351A5F1D|nr:hypothetical protein FG386_003278 [Cryptosporidium ryanae]